MTTPPVLPVIVGADVSEYTIARLFHEAYGIRSLVINDFTRGPVAHSNILDLRIVDKGTLIDPARLLPILQNVAAERPNLTPILLGNLDEPLEIAAAHRADLPGWFLPHATPDAIDRANDKATFSTVLNSLGLHSPAHVTVSLANPDTWAAIDTLREPLIIKPRSGADFFRFKQHGLNKVSVAHTHTDARALFQRLASAGIDLIVQELIPGDDTTQWVINGYVTAAGELAAVGTGQVLLGIHQPDLIGNAGIIYVRDHPELTHDAPRIVRAMGLTGLFSMDAKIDPRTGHIHWLDLNPRMGRGHYYLKVGGIDMARIVTADALATRALAGEAHSEKPGEGYSQTHAKRQSEVHGEENDDVVRLSREGIFAVMPPCLANSRYIRDPNLRAKVRKARRNTVTPLDYRVDQHPKRVLFRIAAAINHLRRTLRYYPRPTDTGF